MNKDEIWKEIIEELFPEFISFFLPELFKDIDFNKEVIFLEQELNKLLTESEEKRRRIDKLAQVTLKSGEDKLILIHCEVQGYYDQAFDKRMYSYQYRIYDRFQKDIVALAIFTENNKDHKPDKFHKINYGTEILYKYNVYKVLEQSEEELKLNENIFSLAILAALYSIKSSNENIKLNFKLELTNLIFKSNYSEKYLFALLKFIDVLLYLSEPLKSSLFYEEVRKLALSEGKVEVFGNIEEIAVKKKELEIAKNMLSEGLNTDLIAKITGLSIKEIESLKK